ncbi:3-hydroxyacyl-ACP dehydratase FabZ [Moraxella nasovis]|uniref:3-hydroxyacyl-ACP dehydratase FabZ n=1 Tax=Moraxella nasovis TaxID=2904121 RepID=UPI001F611803|nr:3-hydroxyacyl-ACP dehydratase FabZ [Moraxella nasovis]UNU73578.1 3-hydroxyacyl-ACP dehydratase FabZ [Moraxella nasovis]
MTQHLIDYNLLTEADLTALSKRQVTMPLKFEQLKHYLPHRYPFMLIDRVTACSPDNWITGYKNLSINEEFFNGHFPDNPIMPGVLMVEAMAQLSGVLGFISAGTSSEDGYLYLFAGVDKVRFKKLVSPGDQLVIRSKAIMNKRDIYKFSCTAHVDGQLACSAEVMIARQKVSDIEK